MIRIFVRAAVAVAALFVSVGARRPHTVPSSRGRSQINRLLPLALAIAAALLSPIAVMAHDMAQAPAGQTAAATIGDIEITGAFSRATLPNAPVAGGFLTLTNKGTSDDRLIAANSPIAGEMQLHEMTMEGDVMKMRELPDGIAIPAGQTVMLQPGGLHLMFMRLNEPLVEGGTVPVTLTFETAGSITVEMGIAGVAADAPAMDHDMHEGAAAHEGAATHDAAAHHAVAVPLDQTGLSDLDAIAALQNAMFDTPDSPLEMGPIVVSGEYAVSDWAQAGAGGRALLRKTDKGWGIHLCAGAGLKDAATLISIGVPEADAEALALQLATAEASIDADTIQLYDSFNGTMMVDEELI